MWTGLSPAFISTVEALVELGDVDLVRQALRVPAALQRRDGSVPAGPAAKWVSSACLASLAAVWFRLGDRGRADLAMNCLGRRQLSSGALVGSWGRGACDHPRGEAAWATVKFLDAAQLQVQTAFESCGSALPSTIDPNDGRMRVALDWLASLGSDAKVADVGCGSGRFLRQFAAEFPRARFIGIDPSQRLLAQLPANVEPRSGGLLRIPAADGEFDGVLAVESLEHALLPEHAVRELCRAVRPGGSVLIIDKHHARQPLSRHEPWERWFEPDEVAAWLRRTCDEVRAAPVTHGSPPATSRPLFLAWSGRVKRKATAGNLTRAA
jgi:malonyl-CoA O-methyltransferase